jgi:hypothetical protein
MEMVKNRAKLYEYPNEIARTLLIAGCGYEAVLLFCESKLWDSAFLISAAQHNRAFHLAVKNCAYSKVSEAYPYSEIEFAHMTRLPEYAIASARAKDHLKKGEIYLAAIGYLSVGDVVAAELLLVKHVETVATYVTNTITQTRTETVRTRFAMLAIDSGIRERLFHRLSKKGIMKYIISVSFTSAHKQSKLYKWIGLHPTREYYDMHSNPRPHEKPHFLLLAGETILAAVFFIDLVKTNLKAQFFEVQEMTR